VTCPTCHRVMTAAPSCRPRVPVVRYGDEPYRPDPLPDRCRDCGVPVGGIHHANCCIEQCGICQGQLLSCPHGPHGE